MTDDLAKDNVLVACPTYIGKLYALEAYVTAYNNFSYPYRGLFMVDNTGHNSKMIDALRKMKVPCDYVAPARDWQRTFTKCWKRILKAAKEGNFRWVASVEADNICPPLTLDILLNTAAYTKAVHVAHSYLWHQITVDQGTPTISRLIGLGCNLILTEVLDEIFKQKTWPTDAFEAECYEWPKRNGHVALEVHNLIDVKHMEAPDGVEYYQFKDDEIPAFTPGTSIDRLEFKLIAGGKK